MKKKHLRIFPIAGLITLIVLIGVFTYQTDSTRSLIASILHAQTPDIHYQPTQKQSTFFEKYPTEEPTVATSPTAAPTSVPTSTTSTKTTTASYPTAVPPIPTNITSQTSSVPLPTTPPSQTSNFCEDLTPLDHNCKCHWGNGDKYDVCIANSTTYTQVQRNNDGYLPQYVNNQGWSCYSECVTKPVIYLYPPTAMNISVWLTIPGRVYISDPPYRTAGWQNVLAKPDGSLVYEGKSYKELYYEFEIYSKIKKPRKGLYLEKVTLKTELPKILTEIGLNKNESIEFMEWWMPKLNKLPSKYVFFSLFDKEYKDSIDKVHFSTQPDVFIEYLVYFKGVDEIGDASILTLPRAPVRKGFTAVEWGGYIDEK